MANNPLDPFGGTGTTGVAAHHLNRKADLIELNPDYVKVADGKAMVRRSWRERADDLPYLISHGSRDDRKGYLSWMR